MIQLITNSFDQGKFGQNVAQLRDRRGLTQEQFGKVCGYSESMIGQIERGEKAPSLKRVAIMASVLGVAVDDLMDGCIDGKGVGKGDGATSV